MKEQVFSFLKNAGISYEVTEHPAVYTMEAMAELGLDKLGTVPKNLFLRDGKGKQHFLVTAHNDTCVNLKELGEKLGVKKLGLASADRLMQYLGVTAGCVSPFGVLGDKDHAVTVIFDEKLVDLPKVGVHPNVHTATLWLSFHDLVKAVELAGNSIQIMQI